MKIHYLIFILFHTWVGTCFAQLANSLPVQSQSRLKQCAGKDRGLWLNCYGDLKLPNGDRYVGEFQAGKPNGKGTLIFKNGDKYVGVFKDIKFNGIGTYTSANGAKYIGEFKDNKYEGKGILIAANGDKYEGNFKEDKFNGNGTLSGFNGDKYIGEFKDDKYEGKGIFISANGNKFEGNFKEDKYHGIGTYTFANGAKYSGEYKDGKRNGKGTLSDINGVIFAGDFKDGFKNGQGTYTFSNGDKYDGEFKDDKSVGKGTFTLVNGEKFAALLSERDRLLAEQKAKDQQRIAEEARVKEQQRLAIEAQQKEEVRLAQEAKQKEQDRILAEQKAKDQQRIAEEARVKEQQRLAIEAQQMANRKALVIGNDSYKSVTKLLNAREDAKAIASSLTSVGYQVTLKLDLNEKEMKAALRVFSSQVQGGDEALFFFAGHGVQLGAANYLLPTDIGGESEAQVKDEAIQLQRILDDMTEKRAKFTLAVIDACRDNPFKSTGRAIGGRGLAPTNAATGQMIVFSAGSGQQALDRLGSTDKNKNGVFTRTFLKEMQKSGVSVDRIVKNVQKEVAALAKTIGHEQVPAVYDQVLGDFYFKK